MLTPLERFELALRRALESPNPHKKSEVVFAELLAEVFHLNSYHNHESERTDLIYLRNK